MAVCLNALETGGENLESDSPESQLAAAAVTKLARSQIKRVLA